MLNYSSKHLEKGIFTKNGHNHPPTEKSCLLIHFGLFAGFLVWFKISTIWYESISTIKNPITLHCEHQWIKHVEWIISQNTLNLRTAHHTCVLISVHCVFHLHVWILRVFYLTWCDFVLWVFDTEAWRWMMMIIIIIINISVSSSTHAQKTADSPYNKVSVGWLV